MPKFGPIIKSLLTNKEKLFELARTPLNEHCSAVLLKKLPKKLRDPEKLLIPCDFPGMDECLALADLSASINLMPLSVWNSRSLFKLSPTCMTLELADRSISQPVGVAEDVFVKVGTFHFPTNFIVVDFNADPRVPLILRRDSHFLLEETDAFLAIDNVPISLEIDKSYYDSKGDILLLEEFLNDDTSSPPLLPQELKVFEPNSEKSSIDQPPWLNLRTCHLILNMHFWREKSHFMFKESIVLGHKISKNGIEVDKAKVNVIAKLAHPTTVKGICSFLDHAGAVLGQRKTKHFQPIRYASKTMTDAQNPYTTMEKELLVVVYAFKKFWPYHVLSKSIVYMDHSTLKYLFNKQDAKTRLLWWVLPLQEFDFTVRDKKGAENLVVDHLSRLENSHQNVLDKNEINEMFPLEKLNMGCRPNKRTNSSRMRSITFGTTPSCLKSVRIKSSGSVFTARKPLILLRLATMDPSRDIMARTTPPKRCLTTVFNGSQSIVMPMTWSNLVMLVNVWEKFHNEMKCLKIPSKFLRFLTFRASISWGRSRPHEETKKTKRIHDSKIKERVFNVCDRVLLFNYRLKIFSGKLKTRWSGLFTITQVFPYGTVELSETDGPNFKVNGHRLKHYFREDIPKMVVPDLQTFPKDQ
nr:reverse transcriptase domain-containing protein [Tanacetum cinerariifolium]